jgi:carboxyl-terminal processing protease
MAVAADDPHAFALDAPAMGTLLALISGQKGAGFGFAAHQAGAHWVVSDVHPGSPAEAAGIKRGDRVISFDRRAYDDQSVIAMLLTVPGQRVDVELEAGGKRKLVELVAEPHARPIVESRMLGKGMGYLRIHYLPRSKDPAGDAAVLVAGALKELDGKKASKIVIDLRDNVGGSPFDVASILVRGDPLVQIQTPGQPAEKVARTAESWKKKHALAVLINRQSYSAAEIVALALQGHGEARVFGEPSGGALTAPGQAQLPGGVTLFYPGQLFLDARGKAPEEQRVTPDQAVPSTTAEDYAAGRDPQLEAAIAWLKKAPAR